MVKNNGATLFVGQPFEMTSCGARIRQATIDYQRVFLNNADWVTHCTADFDNVIDLNKSAHIVYHTFNLKNFKTHYPKAFAFVDKYLPVFLVFSPWQLILFNQKENQFTEPNVIRHVQFSNFDTFNFYKVNSHQFWTKPNEFVKHSEPKPKHITTKLEKVVDDNQTAFEQLMKAFSKFKITCYDVLSKHAFEMPNAIMFRARTDRYSNDAENTNYNVIYWLTDNTWNLSEVDFRIVPEIKRDIHTFENQIKK